ncbi:MAG TPA: tetratricopeptide repeat protein [Candidatus Dormibacteraeota bacterium]|jgi:tetratricopeptide (TPR) repeat protein|nr:tetratricopeptide repeat protein [Candidatus Dormibacteraeota bacterium]
MRFTIALISMFLLGADSSIALTCELRSQQGAGAETLPPDSELAEARKLVEKAELDAAEGAVRQYIARHPQSPEGHFLLGLIYFRQVQSQARSSGMYLAPGELPSTAIDASARDVKVRASLAAFTEGGKLGRPSAFDLKIVSLDYVLLADYPSADKWLTLSLQWDPSDAEAWYYLGRTKYNENRFEEAIRAFQKCLDLHPHFVLAADGLGLSQAGLGQNADAILSLQKAISMQENVAQKTPEPYIDLGDLLNQQARFEEALPLLQQAVTIAPRNIRAHEVAGKAYLNLNRLPEAQRELEAAVSIDPGLPAIHYLLGQIYRKEGNLDKAKSEMDRFQSLKAKEAPPKSGMQ